MKKPNILIAGGTGFVGRVLAERLTSQYTVTTLSRNPGVTKGQVRSIQCDMFSLTQLEDALQRCTYAIYLIHSMQPTARLTQANFADIDLLLADNFARACAKNKVKQIVYLSGLIPRNQSLSHHLASRLEVEKALATYGTPVTTIRSGLIIGAGGSSFQILLNLVQRLPLMVLPEWTSSLTQPVSLSDTIKSIESVIGQKKYFNMHLDIGCKAPMTYAQMMQRTARAVGKNLYTITLPVNSYFLSKLWVRTFSGSSMALISPLIESLKSDMTVGDNFIQDPESFEQAIQSAITEKKSPSAFPDRPIRRIHFSGGNVVRSFQRFRMPKNKNARWASLRYATWLAKSVGLLNIEFQRTARKLRFSFLGILLLELTLVDQRSNDNRMVYLISGGFLAAQNSKFQGRLEFRSVLNNQFLMVAIHDFEPSLPWPVYTVTQAQVHLLVMHSFGKYLEKYPDKNA